MAENDIVLLNGIISEEMKRTGKDCGKVFEKFSIEQILKDYDISQEELESGIIDGRDDGGIDGFYFMINGHLIDEYIQEEYLPKSNAELKLYIITCKHEDTFRQAVINSLIATFQEIFNFRLDESDIIDTYNEDLLGKRKIFRYFYEKIAYSLERFEIEIIYTGRGDSQKVGENILSRANQVKKIFQKLFSDCNVNFRFVGSKELLEYYRKRPNLSSELKFIEMISQEKSYLLICNLKDYYNFVTDEDGKLKKYFLDSNVRDYMGLNRVNEDILDTLKNSNSTEFWFLNNGITILSNKVTNSGKKISIENVQIVNGLQTTQTIYNFFSNNDIETEKRNILVKIIEAENFEVRDEIIKATNNQTAINLYSLHATDKIQRDIEEYLLKHDLYYERRVNYYANQNIEKDKIVTPLYAACGYISLVKKLPFRATKIKSKFMRNPKSYATVFSEENSLSVWPNIIKILKKTDFILEKTKGGNNGEKYLKKMRPIVSYITISKILGKFDFSEKELIEFDLNDYSEDIVSEVISDINNISTEYRKWNKRDITMIFLKLGDKYHISNVASVLKRKDTFAEDIVYKFDEEFINRVKENLPVQPWPTGTHRRVAEKLNEPVRKVSQAIQELISRGEVYRQVNQKLFDNDGKEIVKI